ncbi:hypothetical protein PoB_002641800 [Plakobranchus ocellatus]|uniref:Uncharacterized protein n=1 Tax=Plakobranchus ocellatus TaxID=259542 RepID=A0AAV3ZZP0_9GAST|nr:hypothetical protein PoB_002641800 [Plakobranchus ocellatus]
MYLPPLELVSVGGRHINCLLGEGVGTGYVTAFVGFLYYSRSSVVMAMPLALFSSASSCMSEGMIRSEQSPPYILRRQLYEAQTILFCGFCRTGVGPTASYRLIF